jgi:uncharacterized membrane protein
MKGATRNGGLALPAAVLGVAFSGLFDGILLHQVLQWHHLLSLVPGEPLRDLRTQVLADGLFHILMYGVAATGIWLLWRRRVDLSEPGAGRGFLKAFLYGFGGWNVVDVVGFHWLLHIHRIRVDVDQPLAWDVAWLVVLGVIPLLVGRLIGRGRAAGPGGRAVAAGVALLIAFAGAASLLAGSGSPQTAVLFHPKIKAPEIMAAVTAANAQLVWADTSAGLVVITTPPTRDLWRLYGRGALLVGGAGPAGCLNWAALPQPS